jgi:hypothetical protein
MATKLNAVVLSLVATSALAVGSPASAAVTVYTSESAFSSAVSGLTSFGFTAPSQNVNVANNPYTQNGVTFTNNVTAADVINNGAPINFLISGSANPGSSTTTYGVDFFSFQNTQFGDSGSLTNPGTTAFGFNYGDYVNEGLPVVLTLNTGEIFTIHPTNTAQFIGFTSLAPITTVSFESPNTVAFDVISVSSIASVPEPATWALMLLGFGLIGFAMRKRSSIRATVNYA